MNYIQWLLIDTFRIYLLTNTCDFGNTLVIVACFYSFSVIFEQLWRFNSQVEDSTDGDFIFAKLLLQSLGLHHP